MFLQRGVNTEISQSARLLAEKSSTEMIEIFNKNGIPPPQLVKGRSKSISSKSSTPSQISGTNHNWSKKTFHRATYCEFCGEFIWGIFLQGYHCTICDYTCHRRCKSNVTSPCIK